jgi:hypothetical protein
LDFQPSDPLANPTGLPLKGASGWVKSSLTTSLHAR